MLTVGAPHGYLSGLKFGLCVPAPARGHRGVFLLQARGAYDILLQSKNAAPSSSAARGIPAAGRGAAGKGAGPCCSVRFCSCGCSWPLVAGVYYLLPKAWRGARNGCCFAASLFFYGWGEPVYIFADAGLHHAELGAQACACGGCGRGRTAALACAVAANLLLLGYFKYFDFAAAR